MSNEYEKAVDALMKDVQELRADMKDVAAALKKKAVSHVDDAKDSLHEQAAHRMEQVREAADAVERSCHDGLKCCAAKIEEHPFASLLGALGVGVVLGRLMRRDRR